VPESQSVALKHARFTPNDPSTKSKDGRASRAEGVGPGQSEMHQDEMSKSQKLVQHSSSEWYISITGQKEASIRAARDIHDITKRTANLHVRLPRALDDSLTALRYMEQKLTLPASRRNVVPRWNTEALSLVAHNTGTVIRLSFNGKQRLDSKIKDGKVTAIISSGHGNADRLDDAKRILLTFARFPYPHGARNVLLDPEFSKKTAISQFFPAPKHDLPIAMRDYKFKPLSRWTTGVLQSSFNTRLFTKQDPTTFEESRIEQLRALVTVPQPKVSLDQQKSPWNKQLSHSVTASVGMLLTPTSMVAPVEVDAAAKSEANLESASQVSKPAELDETPKSLDSSEEVFFWPIVPNLIAVLNSMKKRERGRVAETLRIRMVPFDTMKRLQPSASDEDSSSGKKKRRVAANGRDGTVDASAQSQHSIADMVAPDLYVDFRVDESGTGERHVTFLGVFAIVKEGSDEIRYPSSEIDLQLRNTLLATLAPERLDNKGQEDLRAFKQHVEDFILDRGPLKPPPLSLSFPPGFPLGNARAPGKPWSADGLLTSSPAPATLSSLPAEKKAKYHFSSVERRQTVDFTYLGQPATITKVSSDVHGDWQDLALSLAPPSGGGAAAAAAPPSREAVDGFARAALALADEAGVVERRARVPRASGEFEAVERALVAEAGCGVAHDEECEWVSLDLGGPGPEGEGAVGAGEGRPVGDSARWAE
jgi:hypothetical protein